MNAQEILSALERKGLHYGIVANVLAVTANSVSMVANRNTTSWKIGNALVCVHFPFHIKLTENL